MTTIILTSTVNVKESIRTLYQKNKYERIETYTKSVLQWLNKTKFNIVLVENSGHTFDELNTEKLQYKERFEVISFKESEMAKYLENNPSKGESELFAINYAHSNSNLIRYSTFIIKVTSRYFIPELEAYLSSYDLNKYDCLTQSNRLRCEMVGCHINNFSYIFGNYGHELTDKNFMIDGEVYVESIYNYRIKLFNNILVCKKFLIEPTIRGCENKYYTDI